MKPRTIQKTFMRSVVRNVLRQVFALLIPFVALIVQRTFWPAIQPFVWFLFYPAVFFSSWVGGLHGGLAATAISTAIVWWYFIPLVHSSALKDPKTLISVAVFMGMGVLFSLLQGRLRKANRQTAEALEAARKANDELQSANDKLAGLDQAKTAFFSNVSHEFRTPLTLMLGPLEDALAKQDGLSPADREALKVVHRNALRLLRMVNTLLDFSRIEAGRIEAVYEPVDLAVLTADLSGVFRSAAERAGLTLSVDCSSVSEPVYVDRDMWEKIVLNLLSNAFKFTLQGSIRVRLAQTDGMVELKVADTGIGIEPNELPHIFERFHRVRGAKGRTFEGTGIGLALVQDLVRLHGGTASVESTHGLGSIFTVRLPLGSAHLPADRVGAPRAHVTTAMEAAPFLEEALHWLPSEAQSAGERTGMEMSAARLPRRGDSRREAGPRLRILLADDNADMRDYVRRLLEEVYDVQAAANGEIALAAALAEQPDLVLSDVMMPEMDGFELLHALRKESKTATIPVILLSARAGEEARVEGMEAGADDYLIKPFSARELLARVGTHLELARMRKAVEEELRRGREELENRVRERTAELDKTNQLLRAEILERKHAEEALRRSEMLYRSIAKNFPNGAVYVFDRDLRFLVVDGMALDAIGWSRERLEGASVFDLDETTRSIVEPRYRQVLAGETLRYETEYRERVFLSDYVPIRDARGNVVMGMVVAVDITERKRMEQTVAKAKESVENTLNSITDGYYALDSNWRFLAANRMAEQHFGRSANELLGQNVWELTDTSYDSMVFQRFHEAMTARTPLHFEAQSRVRSDYWAEMHLHPRDDHLDVYFSDISERKLMEEELRNRENNIRRQFEEIEAIYRSAHVGLCVFDRGLRFLRINDRLAEINGIPAEEHIGKAVREILPSLADEAEKISQQIFKTGEPVLDMEFSGFTNSQPGVMRFWIEQWLPLKSPSGEVQGINVAVEEVTERKRMEEELRKSHNDLELRVQERTAELALTNRALREYAAKLERLNKELEEFSWIATHDLQEPLRKIQAFGSRLERMRDSLGKEGRDDLQRVIESAGRMRSLVSALKVYSEATREMGSFELSDLTLVVKDAVSDLELAIQEAGGRVEMGELPSVEVDREGMRRVFRNLIGNSMKYAREDEKPVVRITGEVENGMCRIQVEDNGIGFDETYREKIFVPFQRLHGRNSPYEGTGMGLAVCRKVVEMHGGAITAGSTSGCGATFILSLPVKQSKGVGQSVGA